MGKVKQKELKVKDIYICVFKENKYPDLTTIAHYRKASMKWKDCTKVGWRCVRMDLTFTPKNK